MSFEKAVIEIKLAKLQFERNRKNIPHKDTGTGCGTQDYCWTLRNSGELGTPANEDGRSLASKRRIFFRGISKTARDIKKQHNLQLLI